MTASRTVAYLRVSTVDQDVEKNKIYAVKGNRPLDGTIQSKFLAMAFVMAAEIERDLISKRTKEALAARKRAGKKLVPSEL